MTKQPMNFLHHTLAAVLVASIACTAAAASGPDKEIGFSLGEGLLLLKKDEDATYYLFKSLIAKRDRSVFPTLILDKASPTVDAKSKRRFHSESLFVEFDCDSERARILDRSFHAAAKGEGKMIRKEGPFEWEQINPGSLYEGIRGGLCSHLK